MKLLKSILLGTLILGMITQITSATFAVDPTDGSHAKITHVPNMNFGIHQADKTNSNDDQVYGIHDNDQKAITKDDTSIVITSDSAQGFSVKAVFSKPTAEDGSTLEDATIILHGVQAHTLDGNNTPASDQLDPEDGDVKSDLTFEPGVEQEIAHADYGEGLGTTIIDFDSVDIVVDPPNDGKTYKTHMDIIVTDTPIPSETPVIPPVANDPTTNPPATDDSSNSNGSGSDDNGVTPDNPDTPVTSQILVVWDDEDDIDTQSEENPGHYFDYTTKEEAKVALENGEIDDIVGVGIEADSISCEQGVYDFGSGDFIVDPDADHGSYSEGETLKRHKNPYNDEYEYNNAVLMTFENLTSLGYAFSEPAKIPVDDDFEPDLEDGGYGLLAGNISVETQTETPLLTDTNSMFYNSVNIWHLNLGGFDTTGVTDMSEMFDFCYNLEYLNLDSSFNTSSVTNMNYMFGYAGYGVNSNPGAESSTSSIYGLKNFDTRNVTKMKGMFEGTANLSSLDLSKFDTSNVTTMEQMFSGYGFTLGENGPAKLTLGDNFKTSNVINMSEMFSNTGLYASTNTAMDATTTNLNTLIQNHFDTSKVTDMGYMFANSPGYESLAFGTKFDTSQVENMSSMFEAQGGGSLDSLDVSKFNTSKVTDMSSMFAGNTKLSTSLATNSAKLDLSNFDGHKIGENTDTGEYNVTGMFDGWNGTEIVTIKSINWPFLVEDQLDNDYPGLIYWDNTSY